VAVIHALDQILATAAHASTTVIVTTKPDFVSVIWTSLELVVICTTDHVHVTALNAMTTENVFSAQLTHLPYSFTMMQPNFTILTPALVLVTKAMEETAVNILASALVDVTHV